MVKTRGVLGILPAGKNFWNAIYDFTGRADGANWWLGFGRGKSGKIHGKVMGKSWEIIGNIGIIDDYI